MTISKDLFLAILSMDAYNRGYQSGIKFGPNADAQGIGNATIFKNKGDNEAQSAGFYAVAYVTSAVSGFSAGEKTIAYRGTDSLVGSGGFGGDIWNAYGVGAGSPSGKQAELAIKFYQDVAGTGANLQAANISLTGHSSGGGLAGLVGSLYGKYGALFDNMAFENAALVARNTFSDASPDNPFYNDALKALIYGSSNPWAVDFDGLLTRYVEGEFLAFNRTGQTTPQLQLNLDPAVGLDPVSQKHSASLLVILQYATEGFGPGGDWSRAAKDFVPSLFDSRIGDLLVPGSLIGSSSKIGVLRAAIAYSAIDEGARVFGDTGIRALIDDATDLGKALGLANVSKTLKDSAIGLAGILTQFAGQLAINEVLKAQHAEALAGVLSLASDQQTLAVDFSDQLWSLGLPAGSLTTKIIGRDDVINQVIASYNGSSQTSDVQGGMKWLWSADDSTIFDRFVIATQNGAINTTLTDRQYQSSKVALFAASEADDTITGSNDNDFIFGGAGKDTIKGGIGNDLVAGGAGDDRLSGGEGKDFLAGGAGKDTVFYDAAGASGVELTIKAVSDEASGNLPTLQLSTSPIDTDRAKDIEVVELTDEKDTVHVGDGLKTLGGTVLIDALGQSAGQRDVLDFSGMTSGVVLRQAGDGALYSSLGASAVGQIADAISGISVKYANFEEVTLTSGDDTVDIKSGVQRLYTGGGNDTVEVSSPGIFVDLGDGNDRFKAHGKGTIVKTGTGSDVVEISHNGQMLIEDASTSDHLTNYGATLTGGVRWKTLKTSTPGDCMASAMDTMPRTISLCWTRRATRPSFPGSISRWAATRAPPASMSSRSPSRSSDTTCGPRRSGARLRSSARSGRSVRPCSDGRPRTRPIRLSWISTATVSSFRRRKFRGFRSISTRMALPRASAGFAAATAS